MPIPFKSRSVAELKQLCKDRGIKRYSRLTKKELVELLQKCSKKKTKECVERKPKRKLVDVNKVYKDISEGVRHKDILLQRCAKNDISLDAFKLQLSVYKYDKDTLIDCFNVAKNPDIMEYLDDLLKTM